MLQRKRIYDDYHESDGQRLLVDRLWPRGVKRENAHIDDWVKVVAPTKELREAFHQGELDFNQFSRLYREELDSRKEAKEKCQIIFNQQLNDTVTLVYAAKNPTENHVVVLMDYILSFAD